MANVLQKQLLYLFTWSNNQLLNMNIFSFLFLQTFLLINSISLYFEPRIFCHPPANLFPSFWLLLVLFWIVWMLVTLFNSCHLSHASRITARGTLFTEKRFSVSKKWVRSWSHASLITYKKMFAKSTFTWDPKGTQTSLRFHFGIKFHFSVR